MIKKLLRETLIWLFDYIYINLVKKLIYNIYNIIINSTKKFLISNKLNTLCLGIHINLLQQNSSFEKKELLELCEKMVYDPDYPFCAVSMACIVENARRDCIIRLKKDHHLEHKKLQEESLELMYAGSMYSFKETFLLERKDLSWRKKIVSYIICSAFVNSKKNFFETIGSIIPYCILPIIIMSIINFSIPFFLIQFPLSIFGVTLAFQAVCKLFTKFFYSPDDINKDFPEIMHLAQIIHSIAFENLNQTIAIDDNDQQELRKKINISKKLDTIIAHPSKSELDEPTLQYYKKLSANDFYVLKSLLKPKDFKSLTSQTYQTEVDKVKNVKDKTDRRDGNSTVQQIDNPEDTLPPNLDRYIKPIMKDSSVATQYFTFTDEPTSPRIKKFECFEELEENLKLPAWVKIVHLEHPKNTTKPRITKIAHFYDQYNFIEILAAEMKKSVPLFFTIPMDSIIQHYCIDSVNNIPKIKKIEYFEDLIDDNGNKIKKIEYFSDPDDYNRERITRIEYSEDPTDSNNTPIVTHIGRFKNLEEAYAGHKITRIEYDIDNFANEDLVIPFVTKINKILQYENIAKICDQVFLDPDDVEAEQQPSTAVDTKKMDTKEKPIMTNTQDPQLSM